jgi:hypothetical protein
MIWSFTSKTIDLENNGKESNDTTNNDPPPDIGGYPGGPNGSPFGGGKTEGRKSSK